MNTEEEIAREVENLGSLLEQLGNQPMSGRVLGYLLLADPPQKSFDSIVEFLSASKSSISNALTYLQAMKIVDFITFPGDRKRYFQINVRGFQDEVETAYNQRNEQFLKIFNHALSLRSSFYPEFNKELQNLSHYIDYLSNAVHEAHIEYKKQYANVK